MLKKNGGLFGDPLEILHHPPRLSYGLLAFSSGVLGISGSLSLGVAEGADCGRAT